MPQPQLHNLKRKADVAGFQNYGTVQNQAENQTVHGSQYFGNVVVYEYNQTTRREPAEAAAADVVKSILASLAFPGMLDRRDNIPRPHRNTCNWIFHLEEYQTWRASPSGLIWIKGKPGSGKSTLMAFLHRELREERQADAGAHLDFFFNARGAELQRTPTGMLRSLLNQLLRQDPDASTVLETPYREKRAAYGSGPVGWVRQQAELERLFSEAIVTLSQHKQITIFIDAIDEAEANTAQHVMQYLHELSDRAAISGDHADGIGLKLCVSSRHYPVVSAVKVLEVVVEEHNSGDIESFIEDQLRLDMLTIHRSEILTWNELKHGILKHANGMFQWVCLVVPMILKRLEEGWLVEDARTFLKTVPGDLEEVYTLIVQRHLSRQSLPQSLLLFQWVCCSERPLSPTEMICALASTHGTRLHSLHLRITESTMRKRIKSLSGGLAEVRSPGHESGGVVQVVHQTVREFLVKRGLELLYHLIEGQQSLPSPSSPPFATDEDCGHGKLISQCHKSLYRCCLNYLDLLDHGQPTLSADPEGLTSSYPFVRYAVLNLFFHLVKASRILFAEKHESTDGLDELRRLDEVRARWTACHHSVTRNRCGREVWPIEWSLCHNEDSLGSVDTIPDLIRSGCPAFIYVTYHH